MPDEKLAIKIEIDTHPPEGGHCERRIMTRHVTFLVQHYDLPSLMAGKLHAVPARAYTKGRDWYDLGWHLSQRLALQPNLKLLQHALDQTEGAFRHQAEAWRSPTDQRPYPHTWPLSRGVYWSRAQAALLDKQHRR